MTVAPFGSWASPISPEALTEGTLRVSDLSVAANRVWWVERRPNDGGRQVVVCADDDGVIRDHVPEGFSTRTTVHEYGGATFTVVGTDTVVFSELADQRLWAVAPGQDPRPLTPVPPEPSAWRYADTRLLPGREWLVCVRERHHGVAAKDVESDLVSVALSGETEPVALVGGHDFFSAPRPSPDGTRLAWLTWDHPNMPWDGTELWVADLVGDRGGGPPRISAARRLAGGPDESISQPRWQSVRSGTEPGRRLHWMSDRSGWWNLYVDDGATGQPMAPRPAEFSGPDWVFGQSTYDFLADGRVALSWSDAGIDHLGVLDPNTGDLTEVSTPYTQFDTVVAHGQEVVALVASATEAASVVTLNPDEPADIRVLRRSRATATQTEQARVSVAEAITFPTTGGRSAHAYWYPPTSSDHEGPAGTLPPLVVMSHGGPTSSASPALSVAIQFWTSRGLGVVDVDYGGSSGYGRAYRRSLDGAWGIVDVDDCVAAATYLADQGRVDRNRMVIRGTSAGGFTTLCALTFRDVFAAGASLYGIADLATLATDTHKFEARYLDRLVGTWPDAADVYHQRSPVHHVAELSCPVILLQGLDDKVVPPAQAEMMVAALRAKGLAVEYVTFAGEQHGFRKAETIRRAAEAELSFYGRVLGFTPALRSGTEPALRSGTEPDVIPTG